MTATPTIGSSFLFIATKKKKGRDSFIERGTKRCQEPFYEQYDSDDEDWAYQHIADCDEYFSL